MKKSALATLLVAGLFAGAANAATLINNTNTLGVTVGQYVNSSFPYTYQFDYLNGGDVKFQLNYGTSPIHTPIKYSLTNVDGSVSYFSNVVLDALTGDVSFVKNLAAGTYKLSINSDFAVKSASTEISAVPLPGAALLFASSLFGAGALRRRKEKEVVAA